MAGGAQPFEFRTDLTPEENVRAFVDHLHNRHPEFAALLRRHLPTLLQATERTRTAARQTVTRAIARTLDDERPEAEGA